MKNEYFQENLEKRIKITTEMILSEVPNEILERKSKFQGKRRFFGILFCLITPLPFHFEKVFFVEFFNKNSYSYCVFESFSSIFSLDL